MPPMSEPADEQLTPTKLAQAIEVSVPYASQILSGARTPSMQVALRIFHATGRRLGVIAEATDEDIAVLSRFQGDS